MADYLDWEFMLDGDTQDFRGLVTQPGTRFFNLYGGVDHWLDCQNDDFRMNTLYAEGENDPNVVWQVGHELVSLFNGASILFQKDYRKATINKLYHKEEEVDYVAPQGSTALLGRPNCSNEILREELAKIERSGIKFQLIYLATKHEDIYYILKYLDMEAGWVTYYKLLEAIEHCANKNSIQLVVDENRRKSFTNTANNFSLSGFDSRHGFKELTKKNKTPSMKIHEGYKFITDLAKQYLKLTHFK
jgi:hypothetical protein